MLPEPPCPSRSLRNSEPRDAALTCPPQQARYGSERSSQRILLEPRKARQTQCPLGPAYPGESPPPPAHWPLAQNKLGSLVEPSPLPSWGLRGAQLHRS
ncbi:hypothetical protein NN561_019791 [Cricetulus griseus]